MNFKPNMLFLNRSFDKKRLKALLLWFRLNLSENAALKAVEILQGLGFRSATQGAISLGLDDLKTPTSKGGRVFQAQVEVALAHHEHHRGNRTPVELFQHLVDTWHRTSQDLTTEVVQLFHSTERVNPVYMMAFSGARGNISQVRQLVGMRGLMADPRGQIVGFPILSNFREGLTITEYFVSCYGARKGVVDTAIRTADAGYLTRRLADVSHHVVVRTTNCGTHESILLRDIKEGQKTILSLANRLVGRVLAEHVFLPTSSVPDSIEKALTLHSKALRSAPDSSDLQANRGLPCCTNLRFVTAGWGNQEESKANPLLAKFNLLQNSPLRSASNPLPHRAFTSSGLEALPHGAAKRLSREGEKQNSIPKTIDFGEDKKKTLIYRNSEITSSLASKLAEHYLEVPVRSPLSCSLPWGVCQLCYGWGLSEGRRVTLGEAVGIIAAQSIGEPGTQLTLRTFHTGGVFSGELLNEIRAPYSGNVIFPTPLQGLLLRTPHGQIAFLTKVSGKMKISDSFENTEMHFASKLENLDTLKDSKSSITSNLSTLHLPRGVAKRHPSASYAKQIGDVKVAQRGLPVTQGKPLPLRAFTPAGLLYKSSICNSREADNATLVRNSINPQHLSYYSTSDSLLGRGTAATDSINVSLVKPPIRLPSKAPLLCNSKKPYPLPLRGINATLVSLRYSTSKESVATIPLLGSLPLRGIASLLTYQRSVEEVNSASQEATFISPLLASDRACYARQAGFRIASLLLSSKMKKPVGLALRSRQNKKQGNESTTELLTPSEYKEGYKKPYPYGVSLRYSASKELVAEKLAEQPNDKKSELLFSNLPKQDSEFLIQPSTVIFVKQKEHVINNQLLAEFSSSTLQSVNDQIEITQQVLSETAGQIWFKEIEYGNRKGPGSGSLGTYFSSQKLGGIWVLAGKPMMDTHPSFAKPLFNLVQRSVGGFDIFSAWQQAYVRNSGLSRFSDQSVVFDTLLAERKRDTYPSNAALVKEAIPRKGKASYKRYPSASNIEDVKAFRGINASTKLASKGLTSHPYGVAKRSFARGKSVIPLVTIIRGKQKLQKIPFVNIFTKTNILLPASDVPRGVHFSGDDVKAPILAKLNPLQSSDLLPLRAFTSSLPLLCGSKKFSCASTSEAEKPRGDKRYTKLENKTSSLKNCNTHLVLSNLSTFPKINESLLKRKYLFKYHTYGIQNKLASYPSASFTSKGLSASQARRGINASLVKEADNAITNPFLCKAELGKEFSSANKVQLINKHYINTHYTKTSIINFNLQNNYGVLKYNYVLGYSQVTSFKKPTSNSVVTSASNSLLAQLYQRSVEGIRKALSQRGILAKLRFAQRSVGAKESFYSYGVRNREKFDALLTPDLFLCKAELCKKFRFASKGLLLTKRCLLLLTPLGVKYSKPLLAQRCYPVGVRGNNAALVRADLHKEQRQSSYFINNSINLSNKELNSKENIANHLVMKNNFSVAKKRVSIPLTTELCQATQFSLAKRRLAGTPIYTFQPSFPDANSSAKPFDKSVNCYTKSRNSSFKKIETKVRKSASVLYSKEVKGLCSPKIKFTLRQDKTTPFTNTSGSKAILAKRCLLRKPSASFTSEELIPRQRCASKGLAKQIEDVKVKLRSNNAALVRGKQEESKASRIRLTSKAELLAFAQEGYTFATQGGKKQKRAFTPEGSEYRSSKKLNVLPLVSEIDLVTFLTNYRRAKQYPANASTKLAVGSFTPSDCFAQEAEGLRSSTRSDFLLKKSLEHVISLPPIPVLPPLAPYFNKTSFSFSASLSSFNTPINSFDKKSIDSALTSVALGGSETRPFTSVALLPHRGKGLRSRQRFASKEIDKSINYVNKSYFSTLLYFARTGLAQRGLVSHGQKQYFTGEAELRTEGVSNSWRTKNPVDCFVSQGNKSSYFITEKRRLQSARIQKKRAYLTYLNQICSVPFIQPFTKSTTGYMTEAFTNFINRTNFQLSTFGYRAKQGEITKPSASNPLLAQRWRGINASLVKEALITCNEYLPPKGLAKQEGACCTNPFQRFASKVIAGKASIESEVRINEPITNNLSALHLPYVQSKEGVAKLYQRSVGAFTSEALLPLTPSGLLYKSSICNNRQHYASKGLQSREAGSSINHIFPGQLVAYGDNIASNVVTTESGQILYIDSQKTTVRKAQTVLIYSQAIIAVLSGDWIKKGTPLMSLSYQKLVTGDIVQGLPKIEQFFEAPVLRDGTFWSDSLQAKLNQFFQEEREKLPLAEAVRKSFYEIQRVLVEGVLRVYLSQGVLIADKHLEVIVRQMTCKGRILYSGDTGFLRNELVSLDKIENVNQVTYGQKALYHPQVRGITDASLESESFLSAASFQETTRVLSRDAIIGKTDLMRGLKERVIVGELIQAGTGLANNSVYNLLTHSFV